MKKRKDIIAWLLVFIVGIIFFGTQNAHGSEYFYQGDITIDSVNGKVNVNNNTARVSFQYSLINEGDKQEVVNLNSFVPSAEIFIGYRRLTTSLIFRPNERKIINVSYFTPIKNSGSLKALSIDPIITFNDKINSRPVNTFTVKILLPSGIKNIITSNKEYSGKGVEGGRVFYLWREKNVYPTTLTVKWSTLDINLNIVKNAFPQKITKPNQKITVGLTIENKGNEDVNNIILIDNYNPYEFEPVSPLDEFVETENIRSDPRLLWTKKIEKIKLNEVKTVSYSIKYIGDTEQIYDFNLKPCTVLFNNQLVAVSNEVTLSKMVGAKSIQKKISEKPKVSEAKEKPKTQTHYPVLILGAIIGVCIMIFLALKLKKKK